MTTEIIKFPLQYNWRTKNLKYKTPFYGDKVSSTKVAVGRKEDQSPVFNQMLKKEKKYHTPTMTDNVQSTFWQVKSEKCVKESGVRLGVKIDSNKKIMNQEIMQKNQSLSKTIKYIKESSSQVNNKKKERITNNNNKIRIKHSLGVCCLLRKNSNGRRAEK